MPKTIFIIDDVGNLSSYSFNGHTSNKPIQGEDEKIIYHYNSNSAVVAVTSDSSFIKSTLIVVKH